MSSEAHHHKERCIHPSVSDIMAGMRTIIDIDDDLLAAAQTELGTSTKKDTVNQALRYVAERKARARAIFDDPYFLGGADLTDAEVMSGARR